ncbi:MAG: hypothetical protein ACOZBW_05530 [Thermodesulfobacteriota bacterium]
MNIRQNFKTLGNENGATMVLALLVLVLLSIMGLAMIDTTVVETRIAIDEREFVKTLYTADTAKAYVFANTELYGPDNITPGTANIHYFPIDRGVDPSIYVYSRVTAEPAPILIDGEQGFSGGVEYVGSGNPPPGSGYAAGKFKFHAYRMTCNAVGRKGRTETIQMQFYRIGF